MGVGGGAVVAGQFETEITGTVPADEKFIAHPANAMSCGGTVTFTTPAVVDVAGGVAAVGAAGVGESSPIPIPQRNNPLGQRLDVDPDRGLVGECDYILALTPPVPRLRAPLVTILEAKKGDVEAGLGQCLAQMVGARLFNERAGQPPRPVFGCVTSGEVWSWSVKLPSTSAQLTIDRGVDVRKVSWPIAFARGSCTTVVANHGIRVDRPSGRSP